MAAKRVLFDIYKDDLGEFQKRKTSRNRSEQSAHVEDIIDSLLELDSKEKCAQFAAMNLNRLPRWNPNETDNFAIAEKLVALEARMDNIEFIASENKASIIRNKDEINVLNSKSERNINQTCKDQTTYANILKNITNTDPFEDHPTTNTKNPSSTSALQQSEKTGQSERHSRQPGSQAGQGPTRKLPSAPPLLHENQPEPERIDRDDDGFQRSKQDRKKEARRQGLVVSGIINTAKIKGEPPVVRDFFVYRIDKATTDDDMGEHLNEIGIRYLAVSRLSKDDATFCSHKVTIPLDQVDLIMDASTWPTGIRIRRFVNRRTQNDE